MYTLIEADKVTWAECDTIMSVDDVLDLHDALEAIEKIRNERRAIAAEGDDDFEADL